MSVIKYFSKKTKNYGARVAPGLKNSTNVLSVIANIFAVGRAGPNFKIIVHRVNNAG